MNLPKCLGRVPLRTGPGDIKKGNLVPRHSHFARASPAGRGMFLFHYLHPPHTPVITVKAAPAAGLRWERFSGAPSRRTPSIGSPCFVHLWPRAQKCSKSLFSPHLPHTPYLEFRFLCLSIPFIFLMLCGLSLRPWRTYRKCWVLTCGLWPLSSLEDLKLGVGTSEFMSWPGLLSQPLGPHGREIQVWLHSASLFHKLPQEPGEAWWQKLLAKVRTQSTWVSTNRRRSQKVGEVKDLCTQGHSCRGVFISLSTLQMINSVSKSLVTCDFIGVLWCWDFTGLPNLAIYLLCDLDNCPSLGLNVLRIHKEK